MAEVIDKQTMHALSAETRQDIIKMLSKRPYTASEISKVLGKHVTTIAEHLHVLERSGVVRKKDSTNKWVYYALTEKGEKFFRPQYSWVIMLSVSLLAFVGGLYEVLYVRYQASLFSISEAATSADIKAIQTVETVQTYDTNLIAGLMFLVFAGILLFYGLRNRDIATKRKLEQLKALEQR